MKKIPLLAALFFAAQTHCQAQVAWGLKAGFSAAVTEATAIYPQFNEELGLGARMRPTFHAGVIADIPLCRAFSIQPGLFYAGKGYWKTHYSYGVRFPSAPQEHRGTVRTSVRLHTLEIPVNFLYRVAIGRGWLFAGAGPFVSYALAGEIDNGAHGLYAARDITFGRNDGEMRRLEAGANITAGYEFRKSWLVGVNYNRALTDAMNGRTHYRSTYFGLSLGYFINR